MRRLLAWLAVTALTLSGLAIGVRAFAGPLDRPLSFHSPMNALGIFALALLLLLACRANQPAQPAPVVAARTPWPWLLPVVVALPFLAFLDFPLLADDYLHIWQAHHATGHSVLAQFTTAPPDRFFRPLTYVNYALDAQWAGWTPWTWRLSHLLWHCLNAALLGLLARRLGWTSWAAFAAAAFFGVHASRPEVVTWVAARFDLLAFCFGILSLLAALRSTERNSLPWLAASAGLLILALLSKEAAYVVPLLAALLLWYRGADRRTLIRTVGVLCAVTLVVLLWRTAVLGGVGGYQNAGDGRPTILNLRPTTTGKALTLRLWGTLLVPLNWTHEPEAGFALALLLSLAAWAALAFAGLPRRTLLLCVGWVMAAALPVHQFLLIGPDLEKARVLYYPSAGLALLFGALCTNRARLGLALLVLLFHAAALQHNLREWRRVGQLAARTCDQAAALLRRSPGPVTVQDLPNVVDGVYFLKTGFRECVAWRVPERYHQLPAAPAENGSIHRWDASTRTLR